MMGRRGDIVSKEEVESKGKFEINRNRKDFKIREVVFFCEFESLDFEGELGLIEYSIDNYLEILIREKFCEEEKSNKGVSIFCGLKKIS